MTSKAFGPSNYGASVVSLEREPAFTPSPESGLDIADLRIIDMLVQDGRASNRSMTVRAGLTEETVAARIRQMVDRNIIGVTALFDWHAAGYAVDIWIRITCEGDVAPVIEALCARDEVAHVWVVLGDVDIVCHVLLPDREAAVVFVGGTLMQVDGIARVEVSITLDTVKFFHQFARLPMRVEDIQLPSPVVDLDALDWSIIHALVENGRESNREIARSLSVSDGTVRARLRRMEDAGLIRVCAQVHPMNGGMISARALLDISVQSRDARDVARDLAAMPEVLTVSLVAGRFVIMAYVVASTRDRMLGLLRDQIRLLPGVKRIEILDIIDAPRSVGCWARW